MSGDLVRLQHVAPVGGPVAEIAAVTGLLRMHPPHVLLQVRREGGRVGAELAGLVLGRLRRVGLLEVPRVHLERHEGALAVAAPQLVLPLRVLGRDSIGKNIGFSFGL